MCTVSYILWPDEISLSNQGALCKISDHCEIFEWVDNLSGHHLNLAQHGKYSVFSEVNHVQR